MPQYLVKGSWKQYVQLPDTSLKIDQIADGVYEGTGQGFGGAIKVQLEVKDGAITNIGCYPIVK